METTTPSKKNSPGTLPVHALTLMTLPRSDDSFLCPACGAEVPAKTKACPECGSDETTGWSDQTLYDGTGIEDPGEFDYEDWKHRELGGRSRRGWLIWVIALFMLGLIVWLVVR